MGGARLQAIRHQQSLGQYGPMSSLRTYLAHPLTSFSRATNLRPGFPSANGPNTPPTKHLKKPRNMAPRDSDPYFRDVWRRFQLKVHPDLFMAFPKLREANEQSLTKLQGILAEAKSAEKTESDRMPPRTEFLEFYLRSADPKVFVRVPLTLRLPGGHCPHVLGNALSTLFKHAQLPQRFHWGPEYWNSSYSMTPEPEPLDDDEELNGSYGSRRARSHEQQWQSSDGRGPAQRPNR
jgi:hypothetical protein